MIFLLKQNFEFEKKKKKKKKSDSVPLTYSHPTPEQNCPLHKIVCLEILYQLYKIYEKSVPFNGCC